MEDQRAEIGALRTMILVILFLGLIGTGVELLLMGHDEGVLQIIPLALIAVGLLVLCWHLSANTSTSLRAMRWTMATFIAAGILGVALHYKGSAEFQKEVEPSIDGFALFAKVMQSKAPPALAPGLMAYLGLLGLAYIYRGRATSKRN